MKELLLFIILITQLISGCNSQADKTKKFSKGIVYGQKGAYSINTPKGWILDTKSGKEMGLPCVIYIDGYNWQNSPVIMYSKIASPNYDKIELFVDFSIKEFQKEDSKFQYKEIKNGQIADKKYIIMDYQGGTYDSFERVFYIQMEKGVGYVVFSARNKSDFEKYSSAMFDIIESYKYEPDYIEQKK